MYEYIEGELVAKAPAAAVIDAGGVGYRLHIPLSTYRALPDGGRFRLFTHFYVREDLQRLFGFATEAERQIFLRLLTVPKVGPALALAVLSGLSLAQLREAVLERRPEILTRVKGVGKATAERLVQELHRDPPPELAAASTTEPDAPASIKGRDVASADRSLDPLAAVEERHICRALSLGLSLDEVARKLGIDPSTLWRKRKRYGL